MAALLDAGGLDPTVINGGIINAYGTNAHLGKGDWMVVEADESDGTFVKLPADVVIVTNIDPEHLDHFHTYEAVQDAFRDFVENIPFYGFAVMCTDHPVVQSLVGKLQDRRILTYGSNPQADVRLIDLDHHNGASRFSVQFRDREGGVTHTLDTLSLPMPGRHNALNATAAIAVAHALGLTDDVVRKALAGFGGVKRRFTNVGDVERRAHHRRLRPSPGGDRRRPARRAREHRRPRHRGDAAAPLYAAARSVRAVLHLLQRRRHGDRGAGLCGRRKPHSRRRQRRAGCGPALARPQAGDRACRPRQARRPVKQLAKPGDTVICLGAGSITQWAYALPGELAALGEGASSVAIASLSYYSCKRR